MPWRTRASTSFPTARNSVPRSHRHDRSRRSDGSRRWTWRPGPSGSQAAFEHLATLVARLVLASVGREVQVRFPSGEGGWGGGHGRRGHDQRGGAPVRADGLVRLELTARSKDTQKKAQDDYDKDTAALSAQAAADKTFVFVTLARWPGKARWVEGRKAERAIRN